jgi:hypothetical protein
MKNAWKFVDPIFFVFQNLLSNMQSKYFTEINSLPIVVINLPRSAILTHNSIAGDLSNLYE